MTTRQLDVVKASMDIIQLNNLIVSMRKIVKQCRVRVIQKLSKQIQMYRKKKGSEAQLVMNIKKVDRLFEDIDTLKKLNIDNAAKYSLGNKISSPEPTYSSCEMRAMIRIAAQKPMVDFVTKWQKQHEDWESLAAFILVKTGRKLKKKNTIMDMDNPTNTKLNSPRLKKELVATHSQDSVHSDSKDTTGDNSGSEDMTKISDGSIVTASNTIKKSSSGKDDSKDTTGDNSGSEDMTKISDGSIVTASNTIKKSSSGKNAKSKDTHFKSCRPQKPPIIMKVQEEIVVKKVGFDMIKDTGILDTSTNDLVTHVTSVSGNSERVKKVSQDPFFVNIGSETNDGSNIIYDVDESDVTASKREERHKEPIPNGMFVDSLLSSPAKSLHFKGICSGKAGPNRRRLDRNAVKSDKHQDRQSKAAVNNICSKRSSSLSRQNVTEKSLHPSWQASKIMKLQTSLKTFSGKKTTFDE